MEVATHLSVLPLHILPTIPGSASGTPLSGSTPPKEEQQAVAGPSSPSSIYYNAGTPASIPSRRSSLSAYTMPDSYFPKVGGLLAPSPARSPASGHHSPSGVSSSGARPWPSPLNIPDETDGAPLFSNYPVTPNTSGLPTVTLNSDKGKGKFTHPFSSNDNFALSSSPPNRREGKAARVNRDCTSVEQRKQRQSEIDASSQGRRKRAATVVERPLVRLSADVDSTTVEESNRVVAARSTWESTAVLAPQAPPNPPLHRGRRRRASLGSFMFPSQRRVVDGLEAVSFVDSSLGPNTDAHQPQHLPYSYAQPAASDYTLQSVSTVTTVRPLSSPQTQPPSPPARGSSLAQYRSAVLGLSNLSLHEHAHLDDNVLEDSPQDVPTSSFVSMVRQGSDFEENVDRVQGDISFGPADDASLTTTDTSQSAFALSPSSSSHDIHPLSSATTSLSWSAKSLTDGDHPVVDGRYEHSALKLQLNLEVEAASDRRQRRFVKRRMIVIEMIETEVAYTEDLKALVHIYLPQLAALPFVDASTLSTVARNTSDLLSFHVQFAARMVAVLKEERLQYTTREDQSSAESETLERVIRRVAALFVEDVTGFHAYNAFCAGSLAAMDLLRRISDRPEWQAFERRCQIISLSSRPASLADLLADQTSQSSVPVEDHFSKSLGQRARLQFRDLLIMPVQRICRYPLLLASLLGTASTPSAQETLELAGESHWDVGVDIERALGAMRSVAEDADEAQKKEVIEARSALIVQRLEWHHLLTPTFLSSLGNCLLAGSLDVLHHHPVVAPLLPPVKVKYMAAFLYRGYLILAKVKKGSYEAKHFLPLEVFELIDITEGFLPHSLRLTLREHNFDLAASCEAEKAVWAAALCEARDESTVPPFELPASVSPFAARSRRFSSMSGPSAALAPSSSYRHSMAGQITTLSGDSRSPENFEGEMEIEASLWTSAQSNPSSPISPTASKSSIVFPPTPEGRFTSLRTPPTILLRRASVNYRLTLDRGLADIFSEACSAARSKAQLHQALFDSQSTLSPQQHRLSIRDASVLRRRRSYIDGHDTVNIVAAGPIKGQVMTVGRAKSGPGWKRRSWDGQATLKRNASIGSHGAFDTLQALSAGVSGESTDGEATASDFGTLLGNVHGAVSRNTSLTSSVGAEACACSSSSTDSPPPQVVRRNLSHSSVRPLSSFMPSMTRRQSTSTSSHLYMRPKSTLRSNSVPVSPHLAPTEGEGEPEDPPSYSMLELDERSRTHPLSNRAAREEAVIYNRGAGFTNVSEPAPQQSLLKRSLSFASRGRNKSGQSLLDAWSGASEPNMSPSSTSSALSNPISGAASSGELSPTPPTTEIEADEDVPRTLRRKRSLRIFPQLSRFTPMGSSKA